MFGNSKPFGTASAFGASTFGNTSTPFGQSTTAFGAKPATNNVFGSTGFGVQTPAAPMSGGLFGTSTPASGTGMFGQPSATFGAPASTSSGGFGGFGATSTTGGLFGSATPATQSTGGLFGATSTSAFGTPRPAFGGFGATNTGTGLFGQNTSTGTGLFGSSVGGFSGTATSGTTIKFNPPTGTDTMMKGGVSTSIGTRHQCITCMKEYENKSLEELRVEDYAANRKGGSTTPALGFGAAPQQTTGGLFGAPAAASTSAFTFGSTTQSKPLFGTTGMTNTFGTGGSLFGQPAQTQNTGLFGKSVGFGTPSTSTAPAFSFGNTNNTSLFGQNNQQKSLFGQTAPTTGLFGNTATTQATGFGTSTGFGGFGTTNQSGGLFGAKPTGFGTTNTTTTSTFSFGNTGTMASGGLFGQKTTAPTFGTTGFGTQSTGFGSFGTTPAAGNNLFGQNKPATTGFGATGNLFGGGLSTSFGTPSTFTMGLGSNTGTGLFGNTAANKAPGFNFGNTNASGFNFGATNPSTSSFNFGGTTAQIPSGDPNNSSLQQIQQQVLAMTVNPFGDSPLFRNSIQDSSRETEVLKPTNPSAQKALLNDSHYKVDLLPTAKIKPKPWSPAPSGKVFLFDGLEDEEPSLGAAAFVPKRSVKKLVLKNIGNSHSSLTLTSDVASANPTRIDVSISLKSSQNSSAKSFGESIHNEMPLTSDVTNIMKNTSNENSMERRLLGAGEKSSFTTDLTPEKTKSPLINENSPVNPNSGASLNDSIAALHTNKQRHVGQTYVMNDSTDEVRNYSLDDSLNTIPEHGTEPMTHPAGIVLTKLSYFTIPSLEELASMVNENKCLVNNFTIGRKGYGKVMFPGITNVAGLNLDEIVCFQTKEITIYPDDDKKPSVGEELNKRAEITLENVWPSDKTTRTLIKDPERLERMGYKDKIRNSTLKLGATFIDYIPETGSWIFQVEHFSKYGLEDSDEEMDVAKPVENKSKPDNPMALANGFAKPEANKQNLLQKSAAPLPIQDQEMEIATPHVPPRHLDFMSNSSLLNEFSIPSKPLFSNVIDSEKMHGMKASFFEDDADDIFASPLYTSKKDPFFHEKKEMPYTSPMSYNSKLQNESSYEVLKKLRYFDQESENSSISSKKPVDYGVQKSFSRISISPAKPPDWLSDLPLIKSSSQIVTPISKVIPNVSSKIYLKPFKDSELYNKQHLLADAGFFMGRRFRVGWQMNGTFTCLRKQQEDKTDPLVKLMFSVMKTSNQIPHQKSDFKVSFKKVPLCLLENVDDNKIEINLVEALDLQLKNSISTIEEGSPLFVPKPGVELTHELAVLFEKQLKNSDPLAFETDFIKQNVYVWDLLVSLWGKVSGLDTEETTSSFSVQMARREALSRWLVKSTECDLSKKIVDIAENDYLKKIFLLLTGRKIKKAVNIAQKHRDLRLSLLLSQAEGTNIVRKSIGKQLLNWEQNDTCKLIKYDRLAIYCLLSGMMVWENKHNSVNCFENLNWKQALALQLWYKCNPNASIQESVAQYELSFQDKHSDPPYPYYIENLNTEDEISEFDTCYHLLKLYCDRSHPFDLLLMPESHTSDHLDYRLSWLLHLALSSIGYNIPSDLACTLHLNFSSQLEILGLWQWGVFVALHHPDAEWREKTVKDILLRHVTLEDELLSDVENFLVDSLLIPTEWIYEAKAIRASNLGNRAEEAWYLLKAGSWNKSHKIVIKYLTSNAIINEDYDYLMKYLGELSPPERSCTIQDWSSGGQVYLDYVHMCQVVQEVLNNETSAYDLEKFTPEVVSLCKRLSNLPVLSLQDSLSVAEMAKKTATILRSISILQATRTKNNSYLTTLIQSLKNLPMPYDYTVPESRFVAHYYMEEIFARD